MINDNEKQWSRLIDGELSFAEQRTVLAALDETPNGWKRLALGLMEAQAFRRELRNCVPQAPPSAVPAVIRRSTQRGLRAALIAATGLVCLGLGMGIERIRQPAAELADQPVAHSADVASTFDPGDVKTHQTMKLVFADWPAGGQSVDVPVIEAADVDAAELFQQSAVPALLRRQLESQGYVIHEERKYVPVSLANGRQGIAPVSDVVVQYQPVAYQ